LPLAPSPRRTDLLVGGAVVLLALVLRLPGLGTQPVSADEALHLQPLALGDAFTLDLWFNPPLFRLLCQLLAAVDRSVAFVRLLPLAAGAATVALLYGVARLRLGRKAAAFAALLLAVHPWHIRHSQTLRAYGLLLLLLLASLAFTWYERRSRPAAGTPWPCVGAHGLVAVLALLTHYLAFPLLLVEAALLLAARRWRAALAPSLAVPVVALLLAPSLLSGATRKLAVGSDALVSPIPMLFRLLPALTTPGGLSLLAFVLLAVVGASASRFRDAAVPCLAALLLPVLLACFLPVESRYALPALPPLLLLVAAGFQRLSEDLRPRLRMVAPAAAALALAGTAWLIPVAWNAGTDPGRAGELHPDLAHTKEDLRPLAEGLRAAAAATDEALLVVGRGPLVHRLAVLLADGRYPDGATLVEGGTEVRWQAPPYRLRYLPSPADGSSCPVIPSAAVDLLVEAPYPCAFPSHCRLEASAGRFQHYRCGGATEVDK
jgi:hypothetical protein